MEPRKELPDNQLIHEGYRENPYPFWFWLFLLTVFVSLIWGVQSWYHSYLRDRIKGDPFLQVTNRDLSLFLWQNPQHMRANASKKSGYLTAFQYLDRVTVEPELADRYAVAPPELLFLYHTWDRQVRDEWAQRPINPQEFIQFLNEAEEWQPKYWPEASKEYEAMVASLPTRKEGNLQDLPESSLPLVVRMAFQGWRNYFKEGDAINKVQPTYAEMRAFLQKYPHYARNYWRNIISDRYLKTLTLGSYEENAKIPTDELAPFLRAAFYNESMTQKPGSF